MAKKDAVVLESGEKIESIGPWTIAWRKFKQNRVAMAGLIIFVLIVVAVIVVPPMLGYSVNDYDLSNPNLTPGGEHLLGTDKQGRDCLFRLFLGGRISIMVGIIAAVITVILGCTIGGISGYYGGKLDNVLMRFAEIVLFITIYTNDYCGCLNYVVGSTKSKNVYCIIINWFIIMARTSTFSSWTDFDFT